MKINKRLVPIKLHYFLRYAGSAFMTMALPLIVRQKGVSAQGIGFLWSTMPFVGLITNSVSGALADYFRAHRTVFLLSLTFFTTGLLSIYGIPNIPLNEDPAYNVLRDLSSLSNSFDDELSSNHSVGGHARNVSHHKTGNIIISAPNVTESRVHTVTDDLFRTMIDPELVIEEGQAFPPEPKRSTGRESVPSTDSSLLSYLMKFPQFWFIFFALMIEQMGLSTCLTLTDTVCFQIIGDEKHKYGQQRVWGTIGMGILSIVTGALVDLYSRGLPQPDYLPGVIICIVIMVLDLILVAKMNIPSFKGSKVKLGDVGSVLIHPQTILFFVTVYVMGTSLGLLWVFKLMHIEDVALAWDSNFPNVKLLHGLDLGIETFGGEVPFFFLSGMIIQRLGHNVVFAGCIGTLAIRCCLYFTIVNPWWFLPVELLNGISYALFHSAMASYASHLAPAGAQATLQSLVRASFTTGAATAGFLGGVLYQSIGGAAMYLWVGIFDAGFCILFIIFQILITKFYSHRKLLGNSEYVLPSNSSTPSGKSSSDDCQTENPVEEKDTKKSQMEDV